MPDWLPHMALWPALLAQQADGPAQPDGLGVADLLKLIGGTAGLGSGAVITYFVGDWLIKLIRQRSANKVQESAADTEARIKRTAAETEARIKQAEADTTADLKRSADERIGWAGLMSALQSQVTALTTGQQQLHAELADARKELTVVHRDRAQCMEDAAKLRGEMTLMQSDLRRFRSGDKSQPPTTISTANIIAGVDGLIRHTSGAFGIMFHYEKPTEVIRKPLTILMPERYREAHDKAMAAIRDRGGVDWPNGKMLRGHGLTKDGTEFPATVVLSSWPTDKGDTLIAAEVSQLTEVPT